MIKKVMGIWLVLCVMLAGCQAFSGESSGDSGAESSYQEEVSLAEEEQASNEERLPAERQPAEGGELRVAIQNPSSLLPWQVTDEAAGNLLMLIYSPLVNQDEEGALTPCLAESWSWSDDLTELTLQLRKDVTFHDGQAFTSSDVVYSVQQLKASSNVFSSTVERIAQAEIVDESSVRIRFSAPGRMNEEALIFPIVPWGYEEALVPVGTGPFAYDRSETMREMRLKRNENYFGKKPYLTEVTVYFVRDPEAVQECFETTRTNLMQTDSFVWGSYVNQKDLTIHRFESYEAVYLEFNTASGFGASLSNRQKVAYGVDAAAVLRDCYWGKGNVTETLLRPASWYQGHTTKRYGYDAEKARNMAAEGSSQVRLLYDDKDFVMAAAAETVRQQLVEAGLSVTLVTSGTYDIALRRGQMTLMEAAKKQGRMDLLASAGTDEAVRDAASLLDEEMIDSLKVYNLFFMTQGTVTGYGIQGMLSPSDWNVFDQVENLYVKGSAAS